MRFEECLPHQLDAIVRECPLALIPWGALEWHGPQNCVGLDAVKMHAMALDLCAEVGGGVLPPVFRGFNTIKLQVGYLPASWAGVDGSDHAARNETSLMLHYRAELVDLSRLPAEGGITPNVHGIMGQDPRASSAEHGAVLASTFVTQAAPRLRELLGEVRALQASSQGRIGAYPYVPDAEP